MTTRAAMLCCLLLGGACTRAGSEARKAAPTDAGARAGERVRTSFGWAELMLDPGGNHVLELEREDGRPMELAGTSAVLKVLLANHRDVALLASHGALRGQGAPLPPESPTAVVVLNGPGGQEVLRFAERSGQLQAGAPRSGLEELLVQVTDSTCLDRHLGGGHEHRECAVRCIHGGADIALVEKGTRIIYRAVGESDAALKDLLLPHVGMEVLVRGTRRSADAGELPQLEVREVFASHDHSAAHGGAVGMAGELHVEILALRSGEVRVYFSDAQRRPLSATGKAGRLEVSGAGDRRATLEADPQGRFLMGNLGALLGGMVELTMHLDPGGLATAADAGAPFFMTFLVEPQADQSAPGTRTQAGSPHGH